MHRIQVIKVCTECIYCVALGNKGHKCLDLKKRISPNNGIPAECRKITVNDFLELAEKEKENVN